MSTFVTPDEYRRFVSICNALSVPVRGSQGNRRWWRLAPAQTLLIALASCGGQASILRHEARYVRDFVHARTTRIAVEGNGPEAPLARRLCLGQDRATMHREDWEANGAGWRPRFAHRK